jgi:hypothetical protein
LNEIQDEQLRSQLEKILLSDYESDIESESNSDELDMIQEFSESSSDDNTDKNNCQCDYYKSIVDMNGLNVLTKEQDEALKALETIENGPIKRKMIEILMKEYSDSQKIQKPFIMEAPYKLSEVMERFHDSNIKEKPISLNDLRMEMNNLKIEISNIKKENVLLNHRVSILENPGGNPIEDNPFSKPESSIKENDYPLWDFHMDFQE